MAGNHPGGRDKLTVLSTLAVMGVLQDVLPDFEREFGRVVAATYGPTQDLLEQITAGSEADLAILTAEAVDALIGAGLMQAGSRVDLARSYIGVAVQQGAPQPDIGSAAAFRQALLDARSIAFSAAGASGLAFARLIEQMGVADIVRAKATIIPTGFTGTLAATGVVELAVQQVSELMVIPGIDIVGRVPAALHGGAVFSGGVFADAPPDAAALLRFLSAGAIGPVFERHGVEPLAEG